MEIDPGENDDGGSGLPIGSFALACMLVFAAFIASLMFEAGR